VLLSVLIPIGRYVGGCERMQDRFDVIRIDPSTLRRTLLIHLS
jgi:hypothetical protein